MECRAAAARPMGSTRLVQPGLRLDTGRAGAYRDPRRRAGRAAPDVAALLHPPRRNGPRRGLLQSGALNVRYRAGADPIVGGTASRPPAARAGHRFGSWMAIDGGRRRKESGPARVNRLLGVGPG